MAEEENPTSNNLPGTESMKTKYTMEEVNSIATMFETYHKEAHSMKHKTKKVRVWVKKNKETMVIVTQTLLLIYLRS